MAGRMAILRQHMKEKLGSGTSSKKSEIPEVTFGLQTTDSMREHVKKLIKLFAKYEKTIKHASESGVELREYLARINTEMTDLGVDMLSSSVLDTAAFQKVADEAHTTLSAFLGTDVRSNLTLLTENEFKDAKTQEAKFEKARVALDAAIGEVSTLKSSKKTKPETLQVAEAKQESAQNLFESCGQETQETLAEINLMVETMTMEKLCDFMDAYREYFQTVSRYLNDIVPTLYNYKRYVQDSKETRESIMLAPPQTALNPAALVFGQPLDVVIARQGSVVPTIVQAAVDWIAEHALQETGIFRISAAAPELAVLKNFCNTTDNPDFSTINDPHLVAAVLKTYFRELPEPILTYALYSKLVDTNNISDANERVNAVATLLDSLQDPNYQSLRLLFWLLNCIIIYSDKNMMTAGNLATCWAPNLMAPETIDAHFDAFEPRAVIEFMIQRYNDIFPSDEEIEAVSGSS